MAITTKNFIDKLNMNIVKKINANTTQNLDINGVKNSVINGWRSSGTSQAIGYGGRSDSQQYSIGNNNSLAPIVSE